MLACCEVVKQWEAPPLNELPLNISLNFFYLVFEVPLSVRRTYRNTNAPPRRVLQVIALTLHQLQPLFFHLLQDHTCTSYPLLSSYIVIPLSAQGTNWSLGTRYICLYQSGASYVLVVRQHRFSCPTLEQFPCHITFTLQVAQNLSTASKPSSS